MISVATKSEHFEKKNVLIIMDGTRFYLVALGLSMMFFSIWLILLICKSVDFRILKIGIYV